MWPLTTEQLRVAIAGVASPLVIEDGGIAAGEVARAISWLGPTLGQGDVFFVTEWSQHAIVSEALSRGALCVVAKSWGGLADLDHAQRSRCFVAEDPLDAHRALAAFMRTRFTFPVIAVGGSNGKTTTKDMITKVLSSPNRIVTSTSGTNNGWTGTPITLCHPHHRRDRAGHGPFACVLEIGIDEAGAMADHVRISDPDIAVLTALGPEHLAGLGTHEDAIREELVLFDAARRRVWLGDEPTLYRRLEDERSSFRVDADLLVLERARATRMTGHRTLAYEWHPPSLSVFWEGERHDVVLPVPGAHNARNAALAIAVGLMLELPIAESVRALAQFRGPQQRCVISDPTPDLTLIDDTYNASPSSVEAALSVLTDLAKSDQRRRERVVVLGDMLDLGSESDLWHAAIAPLIASLENTHVRLYGDHMPKIAALLGEAPLLSIALAKTEEDPIVLLSDLPLHDQPRIVLVKGSRGMRLERVVESILSSSSTMTTRVGVLVDEDLARAVRAQRRPGLLVQTLTLEDLERGEAQRAPFDIALIGDRLPFRGGRADPEADLAAMAQLLVTLRPHGTAIFMGNREADEEARELLIQVVPPACRVVRGALSPDWG